MLHMSLSNLRDYQVCMNMSMKFENEVVDFLFSPPSQDAFRRMRLQNMLYHIRYDVAQDQIEDVMQILLQCYDELSLFLEWKKRGIERKVRFDKFSLCMILVDEKTESK